jgi:hypothetical protein
MEHDRNKASELREVEVHFFSGLVFVVKLCCGEKMIRILSISGVLILNMHFNGRLLQLR